MCVCVCVYHYDNKLKVPLIKRLALAAWVCEFFFLNIFYAVTTVATHYQIIIF